MVEVKSLLHYSKHKESKILHYVCLKDINNISLDEPLVVNHEDNCKYCFIYAVIL